MKVYIYSPKGEQDEIKDVASVKFVNGATRIEKEDGDHINIPPTYTVQVLP